MNAKEWGAFVVKCMPLIRAEAERLVRGGAPIEADDAVQDVATQMLADTRDGRGGDVRQFIESRLRDCLRAARRRGRFAKNAIEIDRDRVADQTRADVLEKEEHSALAVESHEDDVVWRVDAEKILDLWPQSKGGRQAQDAMTERWLPRFQDFAKRGAA